jgi:alpha-beta hydrolase superfamily lysophospholipase
MEDAEIPAADGAVLRGWLFRAAGENRKAVILLHGQADNRIGAIGYVPLFLKHGYDVLTPDLRAHGDSGGD